jgi:hypothetical protein
MSACTPPSVGATLVSTAAPAILQAFSGGIPGQVVAMNVPQGTAKTLGPRSTGW